MHVDVIPMYRRGKRIDWKQLGPMPRIRGDVRTHTLQQTPLGRPSKAAALLVSAANALPELYDVRLEGMSTLAFVLEGVEFIDGHLYQQAWHCKEREPRLDE